MKVAIQFLLWILCLLFVGRCRCNGSLTFCDDCFCDPPDIWCSEIDFHEALKKEIPDHIASSTTFLNINTFDDKLLLGNDTLNVFPNLQRLNIDAYQVSFVGEYAFYGLKNLSYIYLGFSNIHEIPSNVIFHVKKSLQELHLVNQRFEFIPANAFLELRNLKKLTITYNRQHLDISARAFNGLANLTGLYLSSCSIQQIPDTTFLGLPNLKELDLSYNLFNKVPTAMEALNSLLTLDMSYNTRLDDPKNLQFLRVTTKLQTLQMRYCAISGISSDAVDNLYAIQDLTLANFDGNPFNCTEDLCSFAKWYVSGPHSSMPTSMPISTRRPWITLSPPPTYHCDNVRKSLKVFCSESCSAPPDPGNDISWHVVIIVVSVILVAFAVAIVGFVEWKFRLIHYHPHRLRVHFQRGVNYGAVVDDNREYMFDAYVSHHEDDKPFVQDEMLPRLEDDNGFDLCVSFRNFRLGSNLLENVSSAQDVSRAIIFLINERFMQNGQCKLELEMASTRMLEDETSRGEQQRLILILMEVLAPELVNNTLRLLLYHVAYLEWDPTAEERCWGQLIATLRTMVPERNADNEQVADYERDGGDDDESGDNEHSEEMIV